MHPRTVREKALVLAQTGAASPASQNQ